MFDTNILKQYSINIDFLNYEKKRDVTKNIVYSKDDINTAFIYATLTMGNKIINLEGYSVAVNIRTNECETLTNNCEIIDAEKGIISIPFSTSALSKVGFNKFEVIIYTNDRQIASPTFDYRVVDGIYSDDAIKGTNEYSVLLVLISQVQEILSEAQDTKDRVDLLEDTVTANEEQRKINEATRIANENIRLSNEANRQNQELDRQNIFNEKVSIVDNRVQLIDEKLIEVDEKLVEAEETISNKLSSVDEDVRNIINVKFDNKVVEIEEQIDLTVNQKADTAFNEANAKIDGKIDEMSESIKNVDLKIQEMNLTIDENIEKVDNKISEINETESSLINTVNNKIDEVNTVKDNLVVTVNNKITEIVDTVDNKIIEINETKNNLVDTVDNKIIEFEDRFEALETSNIAGEVIQARKDIDGITHETIAKRLEDDFSKKADINNVYTKKETDTAIQEVSANTINESKLYTDKKMADIVGQSPELLDTLEELANALGDDPNFATTVTNQISLKADKDNVYSKSEVDRIIQDFTLIDDNSENNSNTWSSYKIKEELDTVKSNMEYAVSENTANILKLQEQLGYSISFLSDFINIIKGDSTVYNLKKLSDQINSIKDDLNNSTQVNANDEI